MKEQRRDAGLSRATYSINEAAKILGISRVALYNAARLGELPTVRFGRRVLVPRKALDRMLGGDAHA